MLKNENIICISSIDWDFIWQGHQEIMSEFARNGNRVLFIENTGVRAPGLRDLPRIRKRFINWVKGVSGIRREVENLYVFSPLILPFPYSRIARWINKRIIMVTLNKWMKAMDFGDPIIWTFLPTGLTLDLLKSMDKKLAVYHCVDNFAANSPLVGRVKRTEEKLLKEADIVFVTAKELYNSCARYNSNVHIFPSGVNINDFKRLNGEERKRIPDDLKSIKNPIVGYVGGVHKWIDKGLIKSLAGNHPDYSFVFVGPVQTDVGDLSALKNIYFLGHKTHSDLPCYINSFSASIIPYLITDYTKNVYPSKLNEYLALGKPVVSTDLLEIRSFNKRYEDMVAIGEDYDEFARYLKKAVERGADQEDIRRRIRAARDNSWQKRIGLMSDLIAEAVKRRIHDKDIIWRENFISFYRTARRRFIKLAGTGLAAYLLLFHTSFLWFAGEPLKISEPPESADCIAVFAGGVGESGKAGQGYEERVKRAVELYNNGFAEKIIFSSGYLYQFKEAEIMKALAVSLGIPGEDIILEEKANSTFGNVKRTINIMKEHNWNSALIVSSPYNMRRASLVFQKMGKTKDIVYTPILYSRYYNRDGGVKLRHIRGILHEYLGILYYAIKGYI